MMESRIPVLFLSLPRHDGAYSSTPWQLAMALATRRPVFFCDNPFTIIEAIAQWKNPVVRKRWKAVFGNRHEQVHGVTVLYLPFVFPANFLPPGWLHQVVTAWNERQLARAINKSMRQLGVTDFAFINSFVFRFPSLARRLKGARLKVYHCIDPMVKAFTLKHGPLQQQKAAKAADLIIATAPSLARQFAVNGYPPSYVVANAANTSLFRQALHPGPVHPLMIGMEGKVMGFLGNIERRFSEPLMLKVLELLPDWTLVLAGPVERQYFANLLTHPQVRYLGPVPHAEAPALLRRFDVALIPFQCDAVSSGIYPLKLYEYLAAGRPVVATPFNTEVVEAIEGHVSVAADAPAFAAAVRDLASRNQSSDQDARAALASDHNWTQRSVLFENIIHRHLQSLNHARENTPAASAIATPQVSLA